MHKNLIGSQPVSKLSLLLSSFLQGIYRVENGTLDLDLGETIANINIADNVWNVEVNHYDQDHKLWTCMKIGVHILRFKIKE